MIHITYSNFMMTISAENCRESALKHGADCSVVFREEDIDEEFYNKNRFILDFERGAGYWLWKPYFIYRTLNRAFSLKLGDIVVYTDAGVTITQDLNLLVDCMDSDVMVFGNRWRHGDWCKLDVLQQMQCEQFADREQLQASCIICRNTKYARTFIKQWLDVCQDPHNIDDSDSTVPNPPGWREHRHDQALLTNLVFLHNIPVHWWPAQYNVRNRGKYKDTYPVMFYHHRKRNNEYTEK